MAEHFGFFDAMQNANGTYDREYNGEHFSIPFDALVTNGVVRSAYDQLEVVTSGSNMVSRVKSGIAFIEGHHYFNDGVVELTHDVESLGMSRIDRIVIRKDSSPEARHVKAFIRKGVPSANPIPPNLTRNDFVYEISLAQIRIVGGQGFISTIIDERGTSNGPWAGSDILPSYDDNLLGQHVSNGEIHVTPSDKNNWNSSSILKYRGFLDGAINFDEIREAGFYHVADFNEAIGNNGAPVSDWAILKVFKSNPQNDAYIEQEITSVAGGVGGTYFRYRTETTWSPWRKRLDSRDYDTLFQSVSNGKSLVANAIRLRGVPTAENAEFATMAANVLRLTGFATGTRTVAVNGNLSVDGLTFAPKVVFAIIGESEFAGHMYVEKLSIAKGYTAGINDGVAQMQPGQPPVQVTPVYVRHKADAVFSSSAFSIPVVYGGVYTWYAYG